MNKRPLHGTPQLNGGRCDHDITLPVIADEYGRVFGPELDKLHVVLQLLIPVCEGAEGDPIRTCRRKQISTKSTKYTDTPAWRLRPRTQPMHLTRRSLRQIHHQQREKKLLHGTARIGSCDNSHFNDKYHSFTAFSHLPDGLKLCQIQALPPCHGHGCDRLHARMASQHGRRAMQAWHRGERRPRPM